MNEKLKSIRLMEEHDGSCRAIQCDECIFCMCNDTNDCLIQSRNENFFYYDDDNQKQIRKQLLMQMKTQLLLELSDD